MLDHLDDVISDLSVFHRIDDVNELEPAVFFALAQRLPLYQGVMAARVHGAAPQAVEPRSERRVEGEPVTGSTVPPLTSAALGQINAQFRSLGLGDQISYTAVSDA